MSGIEAAVSETWMDSANCVGEDPTRMQPEYVSRAELAVTRQDVCGPCPVRQECIEHAGRQDDPYGLHGGLWFGDEPAWMDRTCQAEGCGKEFLKTHPNANAKYCPPCAARFRVEGNKRRSAEGRARRTAA